MNITPELLSEQSRRCRISPVKRNVYRCQYPYAVRGGITKYILLSSCYRTGVFYFIIKEKYFFEYKYASENHINFEELYNTDAVIKSLIDNGHIEQLKDINDNPVENQYYIHPDTLKSDIKKNEINENGSNSNGTKVFKIKKLEDKFMIYFVDKYGEEEELGELIIYPDIK